MIVATIQSLLDSQYDGPLNIIVVDDGSTDDTAELARAKFAGEPTVTVDQPNGGKATALNFGIALATGEIIIDLTPTRCFPRSARYAAAGQLKVGAVAGNAKVGNRINLVTRLQALEYITSQNLDRRAFALLDCITVVPGARWGRGANQPSTRSAASGPTRSLKIRSHYPLLRAKWSVSYVDSAIAYTEAPDTLKGLTKQRFRWSFGTLQCVWKHRAVLFVAARGRSAGSLFRVSGCFS